MSGNLRHKIDKAYASNKYNGRQKGELFTIPICTLILSFYALTLTFYAYSSFHFVC